MAAYCRVHDMYVCVCRCGPGGRWWQPTTGFMTMHADCLESGISSGPLRSTMSMGTFTFTFSFTDNIGKCVSVSTHDRHCWPTVSVDNVAALDVFCGLFKATPTLVGEAFIFYL